jgi:prepilin-type N-terminal cleavage/methylation domain-containing protein
MLIPSRASRKAFTLLELIVVIVILGLLAALAIPTFSRVTKKSQDASTSATVSAMLRDASALMAFQSSGYTWEHAAKDAAKETSYNAAGSYAAGTLEARRDVTPARGQVGYSVNASNTALVLAVRSASENVCVGAATSSGVSSVSCVPEASDPNAAASSTSFSSKTYASVLSGESALAPLPGGAGPGSSPAPVTTTPPASSYSGAGVVTTLSANVGFNATGPYGMTSLNGMLYATDFAGRRVLKIDPSTGARTVLAGSSAVGSADGTGASASFTRPWGITNDGTYLYVSDTTTSQVRRIEPGTGVTTTLTGSSAATQVNDATSMAYLNGKLYVIERTNNRVRVMDLSTGTFSTLTSALTNPRAITTDGTSLYVATTYAVHKVDAGTGAVTLLAGSADGFADGTGAGAKLSNPYGLAYTGGEVFVADFGNNRVRKISTATGVVTTVAGSGASGSTDGTGTGATFNLPTSITFDGGRIYVGDQGSNTIRKIS